MQYKFDSTPRIDSIQHLVIHSFALTPQKMLDTLHQYKLSVHYLIEANGQIHSLVPETHVAWHAGPSFWAGKSGLNQTSIGIELEHLDYGQTDYPKTQIDALIKLAKEIISRHNIRPENSIGHSDIAPEFKIDPGRGFPWKRLAENGIGLWYNLEDCEKMQNLAVTDLLSSIGYNTKGRSLEAAAWAFRQRFIPEIVPVDKNIAEREAAVFKARQQATYLSPEEREKFLAKMPTIYPSDNGTYLTEPQFKKVLQAVAYQYQEARKT